MTNLIFGYENWRNKYLSSPSLKKNIWIYVKLNNGQEIYLEEYKIWIESLKPFVEKSNKKIVELGLRYRSHQIAVDTSSGSAVYLVRSLKGEFGAEAKQCYTIGYLLGNKVKKSMWITPELVEDNSYEDEIENCFEEALIYHGQTTKTSSF